MSHTKVVTASAKKGKGKKGKVSHMRIEMAGNGAIAHTHYLPPDPTDMHSVPPEPSSKVFTADQGEELGQHVADTVFPPAASDGPGATDNSGDQEAA